MVKDITDAVKAEKNAEENIPTELYQVYLPDNTLYLAVWPNDLDYYDEDGDSQTYSATAIKRRAISKSKGLDVDRLEVQVDNVGKEWSAYVANYDLTGVKITIWKVFLERTETDGEYEYSVVGDWGDHIPMFSGRISNPRVDEQSIAVQLNSNLNTLDKRLPGRIFASKCQWTFGSSECGVTPPTNSGTIQGINSSHDVITLEDFADTNWINGSFETGDYLRVIEDYDLSDDTVTLEFPLPTDVEVGDTYAITAGCNKVKDDSDKGCDFWDNKEFFGGFPELPKIQNIRS